VPSHNSHCRATVSPCSSDLSFSYCALFVHMSKLNICMYVWIKLIVLVMTRTINLMFPCHIIQITLFDNNNNKKLQKKIIIIIILGPAKLRDSIRIRK